jgi:transcription antitermination protein NusB
MIMSNAKNKKPLSLRHHARAFTVQALYEWTLTHHPREEILLHILEYNQTIRADIDYFKQLFTTILDNLETIDKLLLPHLDRKFSELTPIETTILRIGCCELKYELAIPYRVIINEGIELAKSFGASESHKYINGVFDALAKILRPAECTAHHAK